MVLEHALKPFVQNSKPSWCTHHPQYIQFVRERARFGPVEAQNGVAKKQLLSTLKIICKYVYDDIFAAISLKQAFWRARHLNNNNNQNKKAQTSDSLKRFFLALK